jgi:hypothetical protein
MPRLYRSPIWETLSGFNAMHNPVSVSFADGHCSKSLPGFNTKIIHLRNNPLKPNNFQSAKADSRTMAPGALDICRAYRGPIAMFINNPERVTLHVVVNHQAIICGVIMLTKRRWSLSCICHSLCRFNNATSDRQLLHLS